MNNYYFINKNLVIKVQNVIKFGIVISITGQAILALQRLDRSPIVPFTSYILMLMQILIFSTTIPFLRLRIEKKSFNIVVVWFLLFFMFIHSFVSSFWSEYPILVVKVSLINFIPLLILGLLVWADLNPERTFKLVALLLAWLGTFLALIGLFLRFFGSLIWINKEIGYIQTIDIGSISISQRVSGSLPLLRISSFLGNPNNLAMWLMVTLIFTIFLFHVKEIKFFCGFTMILSQIFAIGLTFSRAGIGTFLIAVIIYYVLLASKTLVRIGRFIVVVLILGGFLYFIFFSGIIKYNIQRFSLDLNFRELAWDFLIENIKAKPFLGMGYGMSTGVISITSNIRVLGGHNIHLQTVAELGFIGYAFLLIFWFIPIIIALKQLKKFKDGKRQIIVAALAICMAFFFHQFFEGSLLRTNFITSIWVYLIFLLVSPAWNDK